MLFHGLASEDGSCTVIVMGRTKDPMTQLNSTDVSGDDADVSFHPQSGSYAIHFTVKVGRPVIAALVEKLHRIQRLIRFVSIIRSFKLNCFHVTLGCVKFRYSDNPELSAEIGFTGEGNEEMKLILPKGSPHLRIQQLLQNHLNNAGLDTVIKALHATLPLLMAFDKIEATLPPSEDDLIIFARGIEWFRLEYRAKNYVLDAKLKVRRSTLFWYITDPCVDPAPGGAFQITSWQRWMMSWTACSSAAAPVVRPSHPLPSSCHTSLTASQTAPRRCRWRRGGPGAPARDSGRSRLQAGRTLRQPPCPVRRRRPWR